MSERLKSGVIYRGENLDWMRRLPAASMDLAYLDPPFFTNRQYEVIWGEEAEVRSFEDRWSGGIDAYVEWMEERLREIHRLLKPTGTMWLHCDPSASHYLKVASDGIFGRSRFIGEVIWKRSSAHSSARRPGPVHDTLLVYTKSARYTWNPVYMAHDPAYVSSHYRNKDDAGRHFTLSDLTASGLRNGSSGLPWRGFDPATKGNHWKFTLENLERLNGEGRIYWPKRGGWPRYRRYLDEVRGVPLQDVWADIPPVNAKARERIGYPTQKPIALLDRIIDVSSNPGDVVFDAFAGCGTSVVAAAVKNRRWLGIDISRTACRLIVERLTALGVPSDTRFMEDTEDSLRDMKPFEFQNWVIERMNGTHAPRRTGDMGIDGFSFFLREPIQVKQSERVGREIVDKFETAVERAGQKSGFIVAFSFTKGAVAETSRARKERGTDIRLVRVSQLLRDVASETFPDIRRADVRRIRPRSADATPTAEELIASSRAATASELIRKEYARRVAAEPALYEVEGGQEVTAPSRDSLRDRPRRLRSR